jgi:hypothetical protein
MAGWIGAFGAPKIVQSDNGKEFKGVMKELLLRHGIKIINGRPRTPRTQGLVEQANGTVKRKILVWKRLNGTTGWAEGLPSMAHQINRTVQKAIKRTPYEVVFGKEARREERVPLNERPLMDIEEEEVEEDDAEYAELVAQYAKPVETDEDIQRLLQQEAELEEAVTNAPTSSTSTTRPSESLPIDPELLRQDQEQRERQHEAVRANQAQANARAIRQYSKQHTIRVFSQGDKVSIAVPRLDRTSTDDKRVFGKVLDMPKDDRYEIITPYGILDRLYPTNQLLPLDESIEVNIPSGNVSKVSLHFVAAKESSSGTIMVHCGCKKDCSTRRCKCRKEGVHCSIACHDEGHDCGNLSTMATRTEKGLAKRRSKHKEVGSVEEEGSSSSRVLRSQRRNAQEGEED